MIRELARGLPSRVLDLEGDMRSVLQLTEGASRTVELEDAGRVLRFVLLGQPPAEEAAALALLPFLGGRRRGNVANYLLRVEGGEKLAVFDFGYGRGSRRHAETVATLESARLSLPPFALRPERTIDRLIPTIGRQDIDFEGAPAFSRRYFLRGDDEDAVRSLFTARRLAALEQHEPCAVAAAGARILYFEPDHLVWPGAFDAFVTRAGKIFDLFRG
jgi:hypothetical protein